MYAIRSYYASESKARDIETLFSIIEKLGPLSLTELEKRSMETLSDWLARLSGTNPVMLVIESGPVDRLISTDGTAAGTVNCGEFAGVSTQA